MVGDVTSLTTMMAMRRRLWPAALFLGAFWLVVSGCTSWHRLPRGPEALAQPKPPDMVRVTQSNGKHMDLYHPRFAGDSLIGDRLGRWTGRPSRVAVPLSSVTRIEVQRFDGTKTAILVVGVGVTVAVIAAAAAASMGSMDFGSMGGGDYSGSCPLVYSWGGRAWRLDSGTFSGAVAQGLARTDVDNLDYAVAEGGVLRLRLANEMAETDFVDAVTVTAVDHPAGVRVLPDGQGRLHTVARPAAPLAATDDTGRDQLARLLLGDGWYWESALAPRDSADPAALRDGLELTFLRPVGAANGHLVFEAVNTPWAMAMMHRFVESHGRATQAWYDSLAASPLLAGLTRQRLEEEASLFISLWDGRRWVPQGSIWSVGPESPKRMAQELDLGLVRGDTIRVRLESVPSFWLVDDASLDVSSDVPVTATELTLASATDSTGVDRRPQLAVADGEALRLQTGDGLTLALTVPPMRPGLTRSYILRSTGWYELSTRTDAAPDVALLDRVARERGAIARISIGMMNDALRLASAERARPNPVVGQR